jgi:hypothetical protein
MLYQSNVRRRVLDVPIVSIAWLSEQLLPQRLQSPTYACLNRTQWRVQAGSDFLMTQSLKKG